MIGVIARPDYMEAISEVTKAEEVLFERQGEFKTDEFMEFCKGASQISLRYLILDMHCTSKEAIIRGIRTFRLRSNARVVLIASGKNPGDPVVSTLVNLGVWDILSPRALDTEDEQREEVTNEIRRVMKSPYNYGNASRWHYMNDDSVFREEKQAKDRKSGFKILSMAGVIMVAMSIPMAYMLFGGKAAEPTTAAAQSSEVIAVQQADPKNRAGELLLNLNPISSPVCATCSTFEIRGRDTDPEQQIHGKIQEGTFYMEASGYRAFPGIVKSLKLNPDSASRVEMVIEAAGAQGKEVTVHAGGELPAIHASGENIPLEESVMDEMRKGWIPIRAVLENAGYRVLYDEESHEVKLTIK